MTRENSYATLDSDGQVPVDQLGNAAGASHPNLATHDTLGLATQSELDAHAADATAVHGITDTADLILEGDARLTDARTPTAHAASHNGGADGVTPAGIGAATTGHDHDADYEAAGGIATHSADTTAVHGIADTSALSLTSHDHDADYEAAGAVATHGGLADPHTGYQKESEKAAASGYASLDAGIKVPIAELPTGTTGTTVALGDAAAALDATHAGAADPHTGYRLESADHSHATTGLQGGTVAHTALTSVGIDDHHARDHAINGAIHTGTLDDGQIPAGIARDAEVAAAYQPLDSDLTAIAVLTTTAFGRALLELADAAALGANHTHAGGSDPFIGSYAPGSFTIPTGDYANLIQRLILTGTQRVTLEGTAQLRLD